MKDTFNLKLLTAAIALGFGVASAPASAVVLEDFVVDESSVEGEGGTFTADKINGAYSEVATFGVGTFATVAFGTFGQFLENDGATNVAPIELNNTYGLYALFDGAGTFAPALGGTLFNFTSASFSLFIDPDLDTTGDLPDSAPGAVTLSNDGDDYMIASSTTISGGSGVLIAGTGGFFDLVFTDFTLESPEGTDYFVSPDPFYIRVNVDGDFDNFAVAGTQEINGDFSAVFIPEPGSLALLGIGLTGLGVMARRRRKAS